MDVDQGGGTVTDAELDLPSAGPEPLPWDTALAAVGYERFDRRPRADGELGEDDILIAEGLHGRLAPDAWAAMKSALDDVRPLAADAVDRAAGRPFWELPDDEFSVLAEPGTVGAVLREIGQRTADGTPKHVAAALHHRRPDLFPLLVRTTRWQLLPHLREGDSGVEAVIHRELRANSAAFDTLEREVAA